MILNFSLWLIMITSIHCQLNLNKFSNFQDILSKIKQNTESNLQGKTIQDQITNDKFEEEPQGFLNGFIGRQINKLIPIRQEEDQQCINQCPQTQNPVCSYKGITYPNLCLLECQIDDYLLHQGPCQEIVDNQCQCGQQTDPHCGMDGRTYLNRCYLECYNVPLRFKGECLKIRTSCFNTKCSDIYEPVCGNKNITYKNECQMQCPYGDTLKHKGACRYRKKKCNILMFESKTDPQCGVDGQTYPSMEALNCYNMMREYSGECNQIQVQDQQLCPKKCEKVYAPVCGQNNMTFRNECFLKCKHKKEKKFDGPCKPKRRCRCTDPISYECGVDNKTYLNRCERRCQRIRISHRGQCKEEASCPQIIEEVCGVDDEYKRSKIIT